MKRLPEFAAVCAIAVAGACAQASQTGEQAYQASAHDTCWIIAEEWGADRFLDIYVRPGLMGSYDLDMRQISRSGDASISQSGQFDADHGAPQRIARLTLASEAPRTGFSLASLFASHQAAEPGTTYISAGDGGAYEVQVRILDVRGRLICSAGHTG